MSSATRGAMEVVPGLINLALNRLTLAIAHLFFLL